MSSSQKSASSQKLVSPNNRQESQKLRSILFDTTTPFTLTPVQLLMSSMGFICMVFVLHVLGRIFPSVSPIQLFTAVLIIFISIIVSLTLNKK